MTWRDRLREAVRRSGKKHSIVALDAGIAPETLSRILNARHAQPRFETVVRIARAVDVRVGWLLDETRGRTYLAPEDAEMMRQFVEFMKKLQAARP